MAIVSLGAEGCWESLDGVEVYKISVNGFKYLLLRLDGLFTKEYANFKSVYGREITDTVDYGIVNSYENVSVD